VDNLQGCSGLVRAPGQLAGFIIHRIQIFVILTGNYFLFSICLFLLVDFLLYKVCFIAVCSLLVNALNGI